MSNNSGQHVAIIGAGIVGISTAIWLQRDGFKVTLVDRAGPAGGTSYGNAGVLASGSIVPVTTPGLLSRAPKMLFSANAPLFLRWSYLPKLLPFLVKYLRHSNNADVDRAAKGLDLLLHDSVAQHRAVAQGTGAEHFIHEDDYTFGYADRAAFEADAYGWKIRKELGVEFEELEGEALQAFDPFLAERFGFCVRCPNHGRISDPGAYVKALAAYVEKQGGEFRQEEVTDISVKNGKAVGLELESGRLDADHVVLAGGVWSTQWAKNLGVSIPMESERGYHVEYVNPSIMPKRPIMVASGKFVMTPMEGRLRCAGIVEFGGLNDERSRAPFELLKRQTKEIMPELTYDRIDEWMGHRPSTIDSLPMIGAFDKLPNVWSGFGHQHIGLTGGLKTGRWLAQLIGGKLPNVDLKPFRPDRF